MGNLVFQATLGGQVNLVGPNTASTYNINVPTVNSTLATLAAQTFAGTQTISSGNLVFSGTSQVVTGDFSNATVASRTAFQSSTSNGSTGIYALPNGTSTAASWQATNAADPTNASKILIATNGSTDVQLVSGRNGSGTYLPLTFYTNGSEQMRLDTSGNLGLGVTPSALWNSGGSFQIANGVFTASSGATRLMSNVVFSSALGGSAAYITSSQQATQYLQNGGNHVWYTAGSGTAGNAITFTQAMTLNANGVLALQGGNTSANGVGIAFPATQSASSDANTLDDYEEGTWTPSLGGNTTYTLQSGTYVKIGQSVTVWFDVAVNVIGTGLTTAIGGLPFLTRVSPTNPQGMAGSVGFFASLATAVTNVFVRVDNNTTNISLANTTGSNNTTVAGATLFGNGARITGSLTYQANA